MGELIGPTLRVLYWNALPHAVYVCVCPTASALNFRLVAACRPVLLSYACSGLSARLGCDSSTLYSPSPPRDPSSVQGRRLIHILPFHPAMWREKAACACQQMAPRTEHRRDGDVLMCEQQTRFRVPVGAKTRRLRRPHSLRSTRAHVS